MNEKIKKLHLAYGDLLTALASGDSLHRHATVWEELASSLAESALSEEVAVCNTTEQYSLAANVEIVSNGFLTNLRYSDQLVAELCEDLDTILGREYPCLCFL